MNKSNHFAIFGWGTLVYNQLVILWGAYVRATGSGAGCGAHWPLCNGEVLPKAPQIETLVEFSHRLSSGVAFLLVVVWFLWSLRNYAPGHRVRKGATFALFFMVIEALIGAILVLFQWVAHDTSASRAIVIAFHLVNTFFLLGAITLTVWWASGGSAIRVNLKRTATWGLGLGFLGVLSVGASGAITALGDTLFPAGSLIEGIRQDLDPTAHFLLRLRVIHPGLALLTGLYVIFLSFFFSIDSREPRVKRLSFILGAFFMVQLGAGLLNLFLLAPVWMQLLHLLLADLVWITLVLLAAAVFARGESRAVEHLPQPELNGLTGKMLEH